jgi:hypothetical protein
MQPAHPLHLFAVPDLLERPRPDRPHRLAVQHVALAARIHVTGMLHIHRPAPQVVAGMAPLLRLVSGAGAHEVGLIFLDPHLVDARNGAPKTPEILHLAGVALHPDHLDHHLRPCLALLLHPRETDEIVTHFLEPRALAIELEALLGRAVEAERDVLERGGKEPPGHLLVEKGPVGREQRRDLVPLAIFDAVEDLRIHERLTEPDQHHVLGR